MVFDVDIWLKAYVQAVQARFGPRIRLIGLQGSFSRGEASEGSDVDVVLILDAVSARDLADYSEVLDGLPERERICGFISGEAELTAWEPSDLFQFLYDTKPILGSLDALREKIGPDDLRRAVWAGACNMYHMCAHNMVHEKSPDILRSLYKSAVFTLQAIAFRQTGRYAGRKKELGPLLQPEERRILEAETHCRHCRDLSPEAFAALSDQLLRWASAWIQRCAEA